MSETNYVNQVIKPKAPALLQAQVEVFADKGVEPFSETQKKCLKYSAVLSNIKDINNLPTDLPKDLVEFVLANKDDYVNFLRKENKTEYVFAEENIKNYNNKFRPVIEQLKEKIAQGDPKELPEYLGSGSNGSAFRIEVDGKTYAAKFSNSITQAHFEIKPLVRAKDIPHTAQLVSYSLNDGVVIMELLPGTDVSNFTPENAPEYSDEHIIQLIDTVIELDSKGLTIDPKPSNFMYDTEQGFSILDYHLTQMGQRYGLPEQVMGLRECLIKRKFEKLNYKASDYEEKMNAHIIEQYKISLPMMVRFLGILKEKYPDILDGWQKNINELKKDPNMYITDLIDRENIPKHPDLEPHLEKLAKMGF